MDVQWHDELWEGYLDRNTNVFHCAGNREVFKKLKQWRADPRSYEVAVLESYKEWNWAYGWNDLGEIPPQYSERSLGTAPAQTDPDELSRAMHWSSETVRYLPLKESEIVAPSSMLIVADKAGWHT